MKNIKDKLLAVPGPGNIPSEILEVMGRDVTHHRTREFTEMYTDLHRKLKLVFDSANPLAILSTSGTGGMEAAVVNLFSEHDKVLVINAGFFGERFAQICRIYKLNVHTLDYPWGETYRLQDVERFIGENPDLKGILITYNETSTGVLHPVEPIAKLTKDTPILTVVDANSGLIANPFTFDQWGIDCAVGCSQKGLSLPVGLAFIALSRKALDVMKTSSLPKFYFNLQTYLDALNEHGFPPFSPNLSVMRAADLALDILLDKGLETIQAESRELRAHVAGRIRNMGLGIFTKDDKNLTLTGGISAVSSSGVVVDLKNRISMKKMKDDFDREYDIILSVGKNEFADTHWRIGLLPPMDRKKIDYVLDLVEQYITAGNEKQEML